MIEKILCQFDYSNCLDLFQIYAGFAKLRDLGVIDLIVSQSDPKNNSSNLYVKVNNKYNIVFDTADGFNWILGTVEQNLNFFHDKFRDVDYYFKRSYSDILQNFKSEKTKIFPMGLSYLVYPETQIIPSLSWKLKNLISKSDYLRHKAPLSLINLQAKDYEFFPVINENIKILFLSRLWDPDEFSLAELKKEIIEMNKNRINYIKLCKDKFRKLFTGGLVDNDYSRKYAPELIVSKQVTEKRNFLQTIKEDVICIATTGLHNSISWKIGEYVAASRAIITEPLHYSLPGDFSENKNYLVFDDAESLVSKVELLLNDKNLLHQMMLNNLFYYNNYVKPEMIVWNALEKVIYNETNS
jgi:hypothetical protein